MEIQKTYLSWEEFDRYCIEIAKRIKLKNSKIDAIVTPLRGGAIPAVVIAHLLGVREIITIDARHTEDDSVGSARNEVKLSKLPSPSEIEGKNLVLVDEIIGTGQTLTAVYQLLKEMNPVSLTLATLYITPHETRKDSVIPDIFITEANNWIVFPWEKSLD